MLRKVMGNGGQHDLWVGQVGEWGFVVVCGSCGAWTTEKPQKLLENCRRHAPAHAARDRGRILVQGRIPDKRNEAVHALVHLGRQDLGDEVLGGIAGRR